jgi:hypothetical protein
MDCQKGLITSDTKNGLWATFPLKTLDSHVEGTGLIRVADPDPDPDPGGQK